MTAVFAVAAGITVLSGTSPAVAAVTPSITVDPTTGLAGGDRVAVYGKNFPAGQVIAVIQCNDPGHSPEKLACNLAGYVSEAADATGGFTQKLTVRSSFDGVNLVTGEPLGKIDCTVAPGCTVLAANVEGAPVFAEPVPISFGS
ncbi:enediyne antibiotic chromoprotein [Amycolatopsis sp. A133]|uniref:enediyne antibiotic chromoprotein n=1 Tax=Amycolatopsis sp. A133 TaxID=3064472 RepID=UPI0027F52E6D|nr:enediyne antibiotic chromoprotein [Amycolatopsis sp. A133]MDQ7807636.1 enediyne antibiotic chromoprotein [Amycolatopsis sp. A133]